MRYSVARQSDTEQQEMLVPGWTRLRNHGARAGSAFGGGSAMAVPASNITAARRNGLILAAGFPNERTPFHDLRPGRRDARLEQRRGDAQSPEPTMQERGRSNVGCAQAVPLREPSVGVFTSAMITPISRAIRASVISAERPGR